MITQGLEKTLDYLYRHKDFVMPHLVIGRRTNMKINASTVINDVSDLNSMAANEPLDKDDAEDYFFVLRDTFPWGGIPPLVVGRPGFDNWLVWWIQVQRKLNAIDVSYGITAVHLAVQNKTIKQSSHLRRKNENGFTYNEDLTGIQSLDWDYFKGCTSRTSHVLHCLNNDIKNQIKILRQQTKTFTEKSDVMEERSFQIRSSSNKHSAADFGLFTRYNVPNVWNGTAPPNGPPVPLPTKMLRYIYTDDDK